MRGCSFQEMQMPKILYVSPLNVYTNEVISRKLQSENAYPDVLCIDGHKRDLWLCDNDYIKELERNQKFDSRIEFTRHYRANRCEPVRESLPRKKEKLTLKTATKLGMLFKMPSQKINPVR